MGSGWKWRISLPDDFDEDQHDLEQTKIMIDVDVLPERNRVQ